jgi:benzoate-CoA ligase family protein
MAAHSNLSCALVDRWLERGRGMEAAIREPKRVWSYARLADEMCRAGSALVELGVRPGERVALLMHDTAELVAVLLGAMRIGAVPTPLSTLSRPAELRALLVDCGAVEVIASADLAPLVDGIRGALPALRHLSAVGGARPGQLDFQALMREADPSCRIHCPEAGEPAFALYSARAAGEPRGVAHPHTTAERAFEAYARCVLGMTADDRVFSAAKLSSVYGLGLGLLFPLLAGAVAFLLPARPRPRALLDVLNAFAPTIFAATPSLYAQLSHDFAALGTAPRARPFQSVRCALSGGEALPLEVARRTRQLFGVELLHGFLLTEALHFIMSNRPGSEREGAVGTLLSDLEARVVDDGGCALGPRQSGALELRGPTIATSYLGQKELGACDGWLRPGDRFFVDNDGFWYYCGRGDDRFKVNGRWVAPDEVERALGSHPAVGQCAVVEGRDSDGLPLPVAFVVPSAGHPPSEELAQQLMEFVKAEIAPYKYPRQVSFVDTLPLSEAGELQRWKLRPAGAGEA